MWSMQSVHKQRLWNMQALQRQEIKRWSWHAEKTMHSSRLQFQSIIRVGSGDGGGGKGILFSVKEKSQDYQHTTWWCQKSKKSKKSKEENKEHAEPAQQQSKKHKSSERDAT